MFSLILCLFSAKWLAVRTVAVTIGESVFTAAHAAHLSIMEGVIQLCDDLPNGAPGEAASYRATMEELHSNMPTRLVRVVATADSAVSVMRCDAM